MGEKDLNIANMNGVTSDDDTTCAFTDMNCVGDDKKESSITNMNAATNDDDTTCSFTDMNCTGDK